MIKKVREHVESLYIDELAITEPKEIDIEAIAFYMDAEVTEKRLTGCEAMIIGARNKAIITVNSNSNLERKRFSIGHELGHWIKDRGTIGNLCSKGDMDSPKGSTKNRENIANEFSSELLLPTYLLKEHIVGSSLGIGLISSVKEDFKTSLMATIRKVISTQYHMGFFAIYRKNGSRRLYQANNDLPYSFLPPNQVPKGSRVYELIFNNKDLGPGELDGDVWCKDQWANDSIVYEHSFHYHEDEFITLVWWQDEEPIWDCIQAQT